MRIRFLSLVVLVASFNAHAQSTGLEGWSYEPLRDDVRVSDVFDLRVMSMTDRPIGRIRNVMLDDTGAIEAASIEFDHAEGEGFALALVEWSEIVLEPGAGEATVSLGTSDQAVSAGGSIAGEGISVRKLIGLPVVLNGNRFGTVTDILFERGSSRPSALLVEDEDGNVFALPPVPLQSLSAEQVNYSFARESVEQLGEFRPSAS